MNQNNFKSIHILVECHEFESLGEMGILMKSFTELGIPHDLITMSSLTNQGGNLKNVLLVIPPNHEGCMDRVTVFSFTPNFKFLNAYIENSYPLRYRYLGDDVADLEEDDLESL